MLRSIHTALSTPAAQRPAPDAEATGVGVSAAAAAEPEGRWDQQVTTVEDFRELFTKHDHMIPMRDGVKLYTTLYVPKLGPDGQPPGAMPMLMKRTPYSVAPYGIDGYPQPVGWFKTYAKEGWIFVYQDVRGRYGSEGEFRHMTPHIDEKKDESDVDESSDTYDTVEWLINNVKNNNGNVGITGNSYGGYYSVAGMISNHPNLKCAAPTAPINDVSPNLLHLSVWAAFQSS